MTTRTLLAATTGGTTFAIAGLIAGMTPLTLARLTVLGAALASAALDDLAQRRVPNRIVLPAAATCGALTLAAGAPLSLLAGLATVLLLLVVSLSCPAALGMGDVKLALLLVLGLDGSALRALALGRQEDAAVGEVQPGEHDELVAGLDALKPVGNGGIEFEPRLRCAFERLIGSVGWGAKR